MFRPPSSPSTNHLHTAGPTIPRRSRSLHAAYLTGAAIGPLVAGRIFDLSNSYAAAFDLCIAINLLGAIAALGCKAYAPESAPLAAITEPASA
jgi:hypothetical protein